MVRIWTLLKISFLTNIRYKVNFLAESVSNLIPIIPAVTMLPNGQGSVFSFADARSYAVYLLVAFAIWSFVEALWSFAFSMRSQMRQGIIDETLMMPLSVNELIIGWSLDGIVSTLVTAFPLILVSGTVISITGSIAGLLETLCIFLVCVFAGYCFALILVSLMFVWKETDQLVSFLGNIAPFVCGVLIPFSDLPAAVKVIGCFFPYTWGLDLIRGFLFHYPTVLEIRSEMVLLIVLTIVYYVIGRKAFTILHKVSRKQGGITGF